ncbi:MAG: hypothetical protein JSV25_13280 [Spirochaetota bacterium]|nr:MAG: hypothetical protein JSV25_13280 [Spirochaetota bacterium]
MKKYCFEMLAAIAVLTALSIMGCATTEGLKSEPSYNLIYKSHDSKPSWISIIPKERQYQYFVGTSADLESFDAGKKEAISDALSQVVAAIGITMSSALTFEEQFFMEEYTQIVSRELNTKGRAKLQDAEIEEIYHEQYERIDGSSFFRVWVLVKYSIDEIKGEQQRLESILALKYGEVRRLEREAETFFNKGNLLDASLSHIGAALASLTIEDGEVFFDRNVQKASDLLMMIELEKFGDNQTGWIGEALPEPLIINVHFLKDDKEIPLPNVPVKFSYRVPKTKTSGNKLRVDRLTTDSSGLAKLTIETIYEIADRNVIRAQIDLEPFIKARLDSVPAEYQDRINGLRAILETKSVSFTYRSDTRARRLLTGIYFVQLDIDGQPISGPITAPVLSQELQRKKFSVKDITEIAPESELIVSTEEEILELLSGDTTKSTERLLFGLVRILSYDTISGYHTCKAEANAKLLDVATGRVLRSWQILRSGTGSSKKLARRNALSEVGKYFGEILPRTIP